METLPWYKSAIVRQQIVAFVIAAAGLFQFKLDFDVDATVAAIFAGVAALIPLYTIFTRIFKPAPNLSKTAAEKEVAMVAEGKIPPSPTGTPKAANAAGFVLPAMLATLLLLGSSVVLVACVNTQAAYKAAPLHGQALPDTAYVVAEHYAAALHEAANIKESGRAPAAVVQAMQEADRIAKPLVLGNPATGAPGLRQLADTYSATANAKTEADLQRAIDEAARAVASLVKAVKAGRT